MSNHLLAPFVSTPVDEIAPSVAQLRETFLSQKTLPLSFREEQLRKLYWGIKDNEQRLIAALKEDLRKPVHETYIAELVWCTADITYVLDNLKVWAKEETAPTSLLYKLMSPRIRKDPLGTVLIIGAFNYPVNLSIGPLIGAIAAGCTAVVKPSEMAPYTAAIITRIIEKYLDPTCYRVVNGGVPETTKLLDLKWDKILYTGSANVGRIIAAAAAKHLTPVILELGGLNPVLITKSADAKLAARRVAWAKVHNAGQICICPNYIMIHPDLEADFVETYIAHMKKFFPNGAKASPDFGRIVNDRHFKRIKNLLDNTQGTILYGSDTDESEKYIEPTLVKVHNADDSLLSEEIFGPVLPMLVVKELDEMLSLVRQIGDSPLGLYAFANEKDVQEKILRGTRSGGVTINDTMIHASITTLPFGGVGESGSGSYRGQASFDAFTHRRTVVSQPSWLESQLGMRYPPYTHKKLEKFKASSGDRKPNFGRDGKLYYTSIWAKMLLLGARDKRGGLLRYMALFFSAFLVKTFLGMKAKKL
ncbi:Hexadecenal dehydrogenase [Rhizina undulata]